MTGARHGRYHVILTGVLHQRRGQNLLANHHPLDVHGGVQKSQVAVKTIIEQKLSVAEVACRLDARCAGMSMAAGHQCHESVSNAERAYPTGTYAVGNNAVKRVFAGRKN